MPETQHVITLLSWAARNSHEAVAKLFLATGKVDVDLKGEYGYTPLLWAAENGHKGVVKRLRTWLAT